MDDYKPDKTGKTYCLLMIVPENMSTAKCNTTFSQIKFVLVNQVKKTWQILVAVLPQIFDKKIVCSCILGWSTTNLFHCINWVINIFYFHKDKSWEILNWRNATEAIVHFFVCAVHSHILETILIICHEPFLRMRNDTQANYRVLF
jgi:hypothetical protein